MNNKTIAYIRVSTDKQTSENQRNEISRYAVDKKITIDKWFDFEISTRKSDEERGINTLLNELEKGDTLIVSELSRLGRSQTGVLNLIDKLIKMGVTTIPLKENITIRPDGNDITTEVLIMVFTMLAQMERSFVSMRTKEALASRKGKGILGHKQDFRKSKYDQYEDAIYSFKENANLSFEKICLLIDVNDNLGFKAQSLRTWFNKRYEKDALTETYQKTAKYKKHLEKEGV